MLRLATVAALVVVSGVALRAPSTACADEAGQRIGGRFPDGDDLERRWSWSGAWIYPVGNPHAYDEPDPDGGDGYAVLRSVQRAAHGVAAHTGVDLGNRHAGGVVRAAANGLVLRAANDDPAGYGWTVVIAHRLAGGGRVYSVYAHLLAGSIAVEAGEVVRAGQPIGRVGRSGHATADHLHFEVRRPSQPDLRWELAAVEDPLAFVAKRLPEVPAAGTVRPWLQWAECAALIPRGARLESPLDRRTWWLMLARAARHSIRDLPADAALMRRQLVACGVLEDGGNSARSRVDWPELHGDLARLASVGVRLPAFEPDGGGSGTAIAPGPNRRTAPGRSRNAQATGAHPTLADACLELAELAAVPDR